MSKFIDSQLILNINYSLYSWQDRLLVILCLFLLPFIHIFLKLTNVKITHQVLTLFSPQPQDVNYNEKKAEEMKEISELIAQIYPRWAKCLRKSFLLWYLLRINRIYSNLVIGVRQQNNLFQSHAWVLLNGKPFNETEETAKTYKVFFMK